MNRKRRQIKNLYKLIYNPHAGEKRKMFQRNGVASLEDLKALLKQYQLPTDFIPTKYPGHATVLAQESIKEGYSTVLVAGGDGTVGEAANGLIGSSVTLGIIPMGSFMNIARMLSIPFDAEKAVQLIKIGRTRKIDAGSIIKMEGERLSEPYYYLETAGIGLDAEIQHEFKRFEKGNIGSLFTIMRILLNFYRNHVQITYDHGVIDTRATLINIANGPFTGAGLQLAPVAKLNDHRLSVTLYRMNKFDLVHYFVKMKFQGRLDKRKIQTIQTKYAKIQSRSPIPLHADATLFGATPVEFRIVPNALTVVCGFPRSDEDVSLKSRTYLDP